MDLNELPCSLPGGVAVGARGGRPGAEVQHGGAAVPHARGRGGAVQRGRRVGQGQHAPLPLAQGR